MAWTVPVTRATGYVVLAADWNAEHVGDLQYLHGDAGPVSINDTIGTPHLNVTSTGINVTGGIGLNSGTFGYAGGVGAGSSVTQLTSRNTAVTINSVCGAITTNGTSIANLATAIFIVNNSFVGPYDVIPLQCQNNPLGASQMIPIVSNTTSGTFQISYTNVTGAATTQALVIGFIVLKAAIA